MPLIIQNMSAGSVSQNDANNIKYNNQNYSNIHTVNDALNESLNNKVAKSGDTMTGELNMNSHKITNIATPTNLNDAANKRYVDTKQNKLTAGSNVTIENNTISVDLSRLNLPKADINKLGCVKIDGTSIVIDQNGTISATGKSSGTLVNTPLFVDLYNSTNLEIYSPSQDLDVSWNTSTYTKQEIIKKFTYKLQNVFYNGSLLKLGNYNFTVQFNRYAHDQSEEWQCYIESPDGIIKIMNIRGEHDDDDNYLSYYLDFGTASGLRNGMIFNIIVDKNDISIADKYETDYDFSMNYDVYTLRNELLSGRNCFFRCKYRNINNNIVSLIAPINLVMSTETADPNYTRNILVSTSNPDNDTVRIETIQSVNNVNNLVHMSIYTDRIILNVDDNIDFTTKTINFNVPLNCTVNDSIIKLHQSGTENGLQVTKNIKYVINKFYTSEITPAGINVIGSYWEDDNIIDKDKIIGTAKLNSLSNLVEITLNSSAERSYIMNTQDISFINFKGIITLGH